jgi:predicted TIM-barrel fold metal-dependent hydrolase
MTYFRKRFVSSPIAFLAAVAFAFTIVAPLAEASGPAPRQTELEEFAALHPIDAHVHVFKTSPAFQAFLEKAHLTLLNIVVDDDTLSFRNKLQSQIDDAWKLVHSSRGHVLFCTTFDPYTFNDSDFSEESVKQINRDFADGAIAVKIWKNVGMEVKNSRGKYIMPDDPKLEPIYQDIARHDKTLIAHLAEPDLAWQKLDVKADPLSQYYIENPQWHMYEKKDVPSKREILEARDHILARNPTLRVVGAHLGSMEKDLDGLGRDLDRYPNFAVDMAARMEYLMFGPRQKVRSFLIKYQDRILYGTDLDIAPDADISESIKEWRSTYLDDWRFLATGDMFEVDGRKATGLQLPHSVLEKIYRTNAQHWIKGL